jgi:hypothetical protein
MSARAFQIPKFSGRIRFVIFLLLTLSCITSSCYLGIQLTLLGVKRANDRALEAEFAPALLSSTLPQTKLLYTRRDISGVSNGGGCLGRVVYIFSTTLSEESFMSAYDNVPVYFRPHWINPVEWRSDEMRRSLSQRETSVIESILAKQQNAALFMSVGSVDFGMLRNGLDSRCGNFD